MTRRSSPSYNPSEGGLLRKLIPEGANVLCNNRECGSPMSLEKETCPTCNGTKCYILLRWKARGGNKQQTYYYRRDDRGEVFRCITALPKLGEIDKAIKGGRFDPIAHSDTAVAERRFENQYALFCDEMQKAYESGDWSYGHYINLKGYRKR